MASHCIVILDDDADVRSVIEAAVAADDYEFLSFGTVTSMLASDALSKGSFFLVDINLPDGDGLDVVRTIRQHDPRVGIIVLSGRNDEIDRVLGLELGADDYVSKPFRARELRARIKAISRRCAATSEPLTPCAKDGTDRIVLASGIKINRNARSVHTRNDTGVTLTTLEFDVLSALVTPPNTVYTREQIMDKAWGADWAGYDRAVDGVVSRLRYKLQTAGMTGDVIRTVRNAGYIFADES